MPTNVSTHPIADFLLSSGWSITELARRTADAIAATYGREVSSESLRVSISKVLVGAHDSLHRETCHAIEVATEGQLTAAAILTAGLPRLPESTPPESVTGRRRATKRR